MQPLAMLIHEGTPNDALIFDEIMHKLKKRRIIRNGDKIFFDKGYFSRENYQIAITKYLEGITTSLGFRTKKALQHLSEM